MLETFGLGPRTRSTWPTPFQGRELAAPLEQVWTQATGAT